MTRMFLALAALSASTFGIAKSYDWQKDGPLQFRLADEGSLNGLNLSLSRGRHHQSTSTYPSADLRGLDPSALRLTGQHRLQFSLVREAGQIDCNGIGGGGVATGECTVAPNADFAAFLASQGLGRPSAEESYELIMVDARRDLLSALAENRYDRPDIEKFVELSAVGVTRDFVNQLAARGYRPAKLDNLTEFAALDITPDFIDSFRSVGYSNLSPDELVQFAALKIDPQFIRGFAAIGYQGLSADKLVELKAMDVTPDYVRSLKAHGLYPRDADQLVRLKAVGLDDSDEK